ncbi:MAG: helix-turn-helix domain-containing protein [Bifidobacteriaceae bacterium]|nr:helix-turn-helix domain-containing protein [Bifidobacteriaceae bacterium]MCI1914193.1 helix-turn-helix domain-containing protein [Bifidobacteriaceae bacterium]
MCVDGRRRYDDDFLRVVLVLLERGWGEEKIAAEFAVPVSTARKWSLKYRTGGEGLLVGGRGPNRVYDFETKLAAVRDFVDKGLSAREVMRKYSIASLSPLERWCRDYRIGGARALRPRRRGRPIGSSSRRREPDRQEALVRRVERLEAENAYLKKLRALEAQHRLGLDPR